MARTEYKYELYIITHESQDAKGQILREVERINIPVDSFEVAGGADRKITNATRNEMNIASEFEQARAYNNMIFYVPPTKDFLALKLMDLRKMGPEQFNLTFVISIYTNGRISQTIRFSTESAWFYRHPEVLSGTQPLLKCWMRFSNLKMLHGHFDRKLNRVIHKEI